MASVASYGKALGSLAKDAAVGSIKGIGGAMKGAAFAEMPGIVGAYGFAKNLRADAKKIQNASQDSSTATNNVISLEMVRQLKNINANIALQTTLAKGQVDLAAKTAQFSEESEREKSLRDDALLNAIKDLKGSKGLFGGKAANDETGGGGFLASLASNTLGSIVGNAIGPLLTAFSKSFFSLLTRGFLLLFSPGGLLFTAIAAGLYGAYRAYRDPAEAKKRSAEVLTKKLAAEAGKPGALSKSNLTQDEAKALLEDADARMKTAKTDQQRQMAERDVNSFGGRARVTSIATGQSAAPTSTSGGNTSSPSSNSASTATSIKWRVPLTDSYTVTSEHDEKREPPKYKKSYQHKGIDLAVYTGARVVAAADGMITVNTYHKDGYGNHVKIDHGGGFTTVYAHLLMSNVVPGTKVKVGDVIGYVGTTGHSTGPHLHFEVISNGQSKNPRIFIQFGDKAKLTKPDNTNGVGDGPGVTTPKSTSGLTPVTSIPAGPTLYNPAADSQAASAVMARSLETKSTTSGTSVRSATVSSNRAVPVFDAAANKKLASINNATLRTTSALRTGTLRAAQYIWKADNQILLDANKKFAIDFSKATNRALTTALKQALFPKGVGVSQASAMGQMYRGQQLGNILKVDSRVNKLFTDVLGKQYGPMFAPVFSNMAKSYLEVGARAAGRAIFGGFGGMDANASNILTGQFLGNLAAGKKTLAFEQLVYGATGQATGAETVFAKAGFQNPMQGIQYMADTLTAAISEPLNNFMGDTTAKPATIFDPRLNQGRGGYVVAGADVYGGVQRDAYGRIIGGTAGAGIDTGGAYRGSAGEFNPNGPYGQYETSRMQGQTAGNAIGQGGRGSFVITADGRIVPIPATNAIPTGPGTVNNPFGASTNSGIIGGLDEVKIQNGSLVTKTSYTEEEQKRIDEAFEEQRLLRVKENEEQEKRDVNAQLLQQQNTLATTTGDQAIVSAILQGRSGSGTGINAPGGGRFFDPNTALGQVGNLGLDLGKSFLTQKAVQALGIKNPYMAILASAALSKGISYLGEKAFSAFAGTETGATLISGAQGMLPSWLGGTTSTAASAASQAAATDLALGGSTYVATGTATEAVVASTAAESAVGATMMESLAVAAPYVVAFLAAVYVVDQIYGGDSYTPNPEVVRIMRVKGNNDISAKTFQRAPKDNPPEQWTAAADQLLNVGFNATKSAEVETKMASPYNFIAVSITSSDIKFHLIVEDSPSSVTEDLSLGAPGKDFAPGAAASKITKFVGEKFKAAYADKTASIDKAILALNKMTYAQVSAGVLSTLKSNSAFDQNLSAGVFGTAEQDKMMSDYTAHKLQMETGGDEYNASTPRMVWSQKDGKYVEAPSTIVTSYDADNNQVNTKVYTPGVLMLDKNGNPIMDTDGNGTLDLAEIPTTVNSSVKSGSLTITAAGATTTTSGAGSTVVANSGNNVDNSVRQTTTIIQGAPQGDLLRTSTAQTKV